MLETDISWACPTIR